MTESPAGPPEDPSKTDSTMMLHQRLIEVEMQLAHQQRLTEQLDEVIRQQDKRLHTVMQRLSKLSDQVLEIQEVPFEQRKPEEEKPPHY